MIGPTDLLHPSTAPHFKTFQVFLIQDNSKKNISDIRLRHSNHHTMLPTLITNFPDIITVDASHLCCEIITRVNLLSDRITYGVGTEDNNDITQRMQLTNRK